jgi:uncharacterized repeat protein (TIGR01451 family)
VPADRHELSLDSPRFRAMCEAVLSSGSHIRFQARGLSMQPNILDGDTVVVAPARKTDLQRGDIVLSHSADGFRVHRFISPHANGGILTRGDAGQENDLEPQHLTGRVIAVERNNRQVFLNTPGTRLIHSSRQLLRRLRLAGQRRLTRAFLGIVPAFILFQLFAGVAPVRANTVPITVTQTPSVTTISPGGQVTFTDVMRNTNNTASTHIPVFTQPIPTNTTFVSFVAPALFTCTALPAGAPTSVACTAPGNFPANGTATLTVTVQVALGTAGQTVLNVNNTPTVTPAADYTVTNVFTSTVTVISADLGLTQSAAPATVAPSGTITFTNTITNINDATGGSTAAAPQLTFATPPNTTFASASGPGYTCSGLAPGGTGTETCTAAGPLAISGTSTITIAVTVGAATPIGTIINGSAMVTSTTYDPSAANNTATSTSTVAVADLALTQSAAPTSVAPGATLTFTNVITNNGPSTAAAPVLTFTTPANTTFASDTAAGYTCAGVAAGAAGTLTCTATGPLANAGTSTITIVVTVNTVTPLGTIITGSANVSSTTSDPNPANNTATSTATVAGADLTMSQTTSVSVVDTGVNFNYNEIVTNNGPIAVPAGTLVVYQQTPPNTTLQSITVDANWTCTHPAAGGTGPIVCTYGPALASGANTSADPIVMTLSVNSGTAYGTTILNSATVTSQTTDPVPTNNTSVTTVRVEPVAQADLALTMTAAPTPVFLSSSLTYTIQVQNLGQASAATVLVADTIPTGTTLVSATGSAGWACIGTTAISCSLTGTLALNATGTITITVTSPVTTGPITNTATVSSSTADPVSANNSATVITVVQPLVCATPGKDGAGAGITGIVNTYYPGSGMVTAGTNNSTITLGAALGSATPVTIASGDLLLIMQMQDSLINDTNSGVYGDGSLGDPANGSSNQQSTGLFEFVTATSAVGTAGGTLSFTGAGANGGTINTYTSAAATATAGQQTFQVIRVPQYTSASLTSGLVALAWNGSVGGVLAIDVASQLTLGSATVAADVTGFRGGGGMELRGQATGLNTDYVTTSPATVPAIGAADAPANSGANGSKGEGTAGTPHWLAPAQSTMLATTSTIAVSSGQTVAEGLPAGSFARGAPGNAGGGATDGDPVSITGGGNDKNSGGGAGGNGGAGGLGGYGWDSFASLNSTNGGFGGAAFPASTGAIVMGGGGGAGSTNNGSYYISAASNRADCGAACTGVFSSGGVGGGIIIVHTGSVTGSATLTSNGQSTLATLNDSTGGAGAGGTIIFYANTGPLTGLTVNANGGNGGLAWPNTAPGPFVNGPTVGGQRHGPGGGGGGGVVLLSGTPTAVSVNGGQNGYTDTVQDSFGATPGQTGVAATNLIITETPGAQSGAYCAGADLAVTNAGTPPVVVPGNNITYTQTVTNNGPFDALNAVFSEAIPANTTFQSLAVPSGWSCTTPAVGASGSINCTDPVIPNGAAASSFTLVVKVNAATPDQTQITDVDAITSGTNDPNLSNNNAAVTTIVGFSTEANLSVTNTATPNPVADGSNITYSQIVTNNGPAAAANVSFTETLPANTTFFSMATPAGWSCSDPAVGSPGTITCTIASLAAGATATFAPVLKVTAGTASGTPITDTDNVSSTTPDPNPTSNSATVTVLVASAGQADLAVAVSASPNPVLVANNVTFAQKVTNNGPAAATTDVFTETIPANTSFVSLGTPVGWICTTPAVGATTGTITCNAGTDASGTVSSFPLVVKVVSGTAPGTVISTNSSVSSATSDPNLTNNSAPTCAAVPSACTVVASPTQADVAIVKTASPEPVDEGTNLVYTLTVTNNGPAIAQGVTVSDPLPNAVTFCTSISPTCPSLSTVSTTQGTCAQSGGTVSCTLGSITVGGQVTITINVNATTFSSPSGTVCNTVNGIPYVVCNIAMVTANGIPPFVCSPPPTASGASSDPNLLNNCSEADTTIQASSAVQLVSFQAFSRPDGSALLEWKTREEVRNLGFNVYREDATGRHRLNSGLIAGSALILKKSQPQHAAKTYQWIDPHPVVGATYVLEDVDLNGSKNTHGPAQIETSATRTFSANVSASPLLKQMNQVARGSVSPGTSGGRRAQFFYHPIAPPAPVFAPANLSGDNAIKISVQQEGWYRVTQAQLVSAGFDARSNAQTLQLFAEGVEQPILILGNQVGAFGPNDAIEFYGTGIDTPYSGTRVYWLVSNRQAGKRIQLARENTGNSTPQAFPAEAIREDRTTYFAALLNSEDQDNFFGDLVTNAPADEELDAPHSVSSSLPVSIDVTLQGVTDQQDHSVSVTFNGSFLGNMDFSNLANFKSTFPVDPGLVQDGANTVTLTALDGDNDVSLVQSVVLHYAHSFAADNDWLEMQVAPGSEVSVAGFSNGQVRVFDITNPLAIEQLPAAVQLGASGFAAQFGVPGSAMLGTLRTLVAVAADQISSPSALTFHPRSTLLEHQAGANIVMISHPDFVSSLAPLAQLREEQGNTVKIVTTDEIFDAFNFGERSPYAMRDFLQQTLTQWRMRPQFVLLVGDASLDPRNYLGFGDFDFVPTRMIDTAALKTATDDWFTDFNQTGFATIATGRLPARTPADAALMVSKIVGYEHDGNAGAWSGQALIVADQNTGSNFSTTANSVAGLFGGPYSVSTILADQQDPQTVRQQIVDAVNSGQAIVDFVGHGSVEQWSFTDFFDDTDAAALQNGGRLPVFLIMNCLNGFFQDVYTQSLAESLILAPNGGAVAVWASSGFTDPGPQASLNLSLTHFLASNPKLPLGKAILQAKTTTVDPDVRRTWILFGDPAMHIHTAAAPPWPAPHPPKRGNPPRREPRYQE